MHSFSPTSAPDSAKQLVSALHNIEWNSFSLGVHFPSSFSEEQKKEVKQNFQAELIRKLESLSGKRYASSRADIEFLLDWKNAQFSFLIAPLFIEGRYNKFKRGIAQTFHYCLHCKGRGCPSCNNTGKQTAESVQELLASILVPSFVAKELIFHGSGREDVDVRMLGSGRLFVAELVSPRRRSANLSKLENEINTTFKEKIAVHSLAFSSSSRVVEIKQFQHAKRYHALVECSGAAEASKLASYLNKKFDVLQQTPLRVEKRRALKERPHWVVLEKTEVVSSTSLEIELQCSAGMYVKEWISGDGGRSNPSLSSWLGIPCVCKELDVLEILD
ncbi:MAG: tRNA pseudouridine(54/55) synthase Pus10 [Candidatus Diapherotrites archaeon]